MSLVRWVASQRRRDEGREGHKWWRKVLVCACCGSFPSPLASVGPLRAAALHCAHSREETVLCLCCDSASGGHHLSPSGILAGVSSRGAAVGGHPRTCVALALSKVRELKWASVRGSRLPVRAPGHCQQRRLRWALTAGVGAGSTALPSLTGSPSVCLRLGLFPPSPRCARTHCTITLSLSP